MNCMKNIQKETEALTKKVITIISKGFVIQVKSNSSV